jgi:protein TonB
MNTAQSRFVPITGGAVAATFGLFYLMQGLVAGDSMEFPDTEPRRWIDIAIEDIKPPVVRQLDRVTPPPPVEDQPQIEIPEVESGGDPVLTAGMAPRIRPLGAKSTLLQPGFSDGEMVPIVRVLPTYPRIAQERGVEGWVTLQFTVSEHGTVEEPVVVDAEPKGQFDRAALRAIKKFKYKPTVVDGQPRATRNVRFRMVFELSDMG